MSKDDAEYLLTMVPTVHRRIDAAIIVLHRFRWPSSSRQMVP